ncbi:MAG: hypothetical protein KDD63_05720, partial [Bacteroidetes bacterium]|nr:hypothetical protein [Bacteroidota bacterium]
MDRPEPEPVPEPVGKLTIGEGVTEDDFEKFPGEVGFILNTREIAKKGYKPTQAVLTIQGNHGDYSQTIDLDEVAFMGQIKIPLEGLSEEAEKELKEGISVSADIKDANGTSILSQNFSAVIFKANPEPKMVDATSLSETAEISTIALKENSPYYIQQVGSDGKPLKKAVKHYKTIVSVFGAPKPTGLLAVTNYVEFLGVEDEPEMIFNFVPIPGEPNTYALKLQTEQKFLGLAQVYQTGYYTAPIVSPYTTLAELQNSGSYDNYKFLIEKESEGIYSIKSHSVSWKDKAGLGINITSGETTYWRIVSNSLEWSVEEVGTTILSPILSEPTTDFGANSTLTNCGSGTLEQTVGIDQSESITNYVGWEENFSLTASSSMSVTATIGVSFTAGFFGAKAKYSGSLSTTIDASVSMTESSSEFGGSEKTLEETIFFERKVSVPPGKASLVYDVAQFYDNTLVQFVQRLRLRANDNGKPLSGEEIQSQLKFSRF